MMSTLLSTPVTLTHCIVCRVRRKIRTGELDISEDYFLTCLYPNGLGDSDDVERGFLRSGLLVKVWDFSIYDSSTDRLSDFLYPFHITIILRSVQ
jgi:hypothetical protein